MTAPAVLLSIIQRQKNHVVVNCRRDISLVIYSIFYIRNKILI